jgi:hypothetical protein
MSRLPLCFIMSSAPSTEEILSHHGSGTGLQNIKLDMKRCNAGVYLNGLSVDTPCGPRSLPQ